MKIKDLKNGQFEVSIKGLPQFYVKNYNAALELAFKIGGVPNADNRN